MESVHQNGKKNGEALHYGNLKFAIVEDKKDWDLSGINSYDAVIITKTKPVFVQNMVQKIRTSKAENIFLKPIFVIGEVDDLDRTTRCLIDGNLASKNNLMYASETVNAIKNKIDNLDKD